MAVANPMINVTLPPEVAALLQETAQKNSTSVSSVALDLIEWAIEEREDMHFSRIADSIEQSNPKWIQDSDSIWEA